MTYPQPQRKSVREQRIIPTSAEPLVSALNTRPVSSPLQMPEQTLCKLDQNQAHSGPIPPGRYRDPLCDNSDQRGLLFDTGKAL